LYQHFWTLRVRKCQDAICQVIESIDLIEELEDPSCDFRLACGIREYFEQNRGISTSSTGILDLQDVEGVAPHVALQHFLEFLSNVSWAEVFLKTEASTMMTLVIASWLCDYLESSPGVVSNPIRGAIESVFSAILTNCILPKLRQQAILIKYLLIDHKLTLSLIQYAITLVQEKVGLWALLQMHLLFKYIAHALLDNVTQNSTSHLEDFLFQRLKRLSLPVAGFPMRYWRYTYLYMADNPLLIDDACVLTLLTLIFLCFELPEVDPSPFLVL